MPSFRQELRRTCVAPFGIGVAAAVVINSSLLTFASWSTNVAVRMSDRVGLHLSEAYFKQGPPPPFPWKNVLLNTCGQLAALLLIWLVALWFYPETDQPSPQ